MDLTDRKKQILKAVVEDYVSTAEPVGSKAIAAQMGGKISSATIRNELADLVEQGYLEQPHTSAGRVPSPKGYRLYVNELMERQKLSVAETEKLNAALEMKMEQLDRVMAQVGKAVSALAGYPVYTAATGRKTFVARHFDLLPVDNRSFIVVLLMGDNRVKSQLLRLQMALSAEQAPALANLLNTHFVNCSADEMSQRLLHMTDQLPPEQFLLLSQIVTYAADTLDEVGRREVQTVGASQLLKLPEFQNAGKAHELISYLSDGQAELPAPDENMPMKILIGPENVSRALMDTSVVVASYDIGDDMRGLIGVVGPTRMDYASVTARLSYFAEGMARMFGKKDLPSKKEEPKT